MSLPSTPMCRTAVVAEATARPTAAAAREAAVRGAVARVVVERAVAERAEVAMVEAAREVGARVEEGWVAVERGRAGLGSTHTPALAHLLSKKGLAH